MPSRSISHIHPQLFSQPLTQTLITLCPVPRELIKYILLGHATVISLGNSPLSFTIFMTHLTIPRNTFYLEPKVPTPISAQEEFPTRQHTDTKTDLRTRNNQETKHSPNKDINKHLDLQSSQFQMPRHQRKNTINNSQKNVSPLAPSSHTTAGLEFSSIAETQEKRPRNSF